MVLYIHNLGGRAWAQQSMLQCPAAVDPAPCWYPLRTHAALCGRVRSHGAAAARVLGVGTATSCCLHYGCCQLDVRGMFFDQVGYRVGEAPGGMYGPCHGRLRSSACSACHHGGFASNSSWKRHDVLCTWVVPLIGIGHGTSSLITCISVREEHLCD
jgi:hypothetical protein